MWLFPCSSGRYLISGDTEGVVSVWDTQTVPPEANEELLEPQLRFQAHWDCTNGVRYPRKAHRANPTALPHKHDAFVSQYY